MTGAMPSSGANRITGRSIARDDAGAASRRVLILNALTFAMKIAAVYASIPFWRQLGIL